MSTSAPFDVTPEALEIVAQSLRQFPEMHAGLMLVPEFEQGDEQGTLVLRFERESFWMAHDSPDHFSQWPRVELCGQSIPIAADALEALRGKTLTVEVINIIFEGQKILVASDTPVQATLP